MNVPFTRLDEIRDVSPFPFALSEAEGAQRPTPTSKCGATCARWHRGAVLRRRLPSFVGRPRSGRTEHTVPRPWRCHFAAANRREQRRSRRRAARRRLRIQQLWRRIPRLERRRADGLGRSRSACRRAGAPPPRTRAAHAPSARGGGVACGHRRGGAGLAAGGGVVLGARHARSRVARRAAEPPPAGPPRPRERGPDHVRWGADLGLP